MSTAPPTTTGSTNSSGNSQLDSQVTAALTSADNSASQNLQNLQLARQARLSQLTRTAASLTAEYGATDSRAVAAQAAVSAGTATVARVSMLHQQLGTPAPVVTATTGWALHGRVYTAQSQPAASLTVFLVDAQKTYEQQYGFSYTDSTGYFVLNYAGTGGKFHKVIPLFVAIANSQGQAVYLSTTPFQPVPGAATYQNITLPAGAPPLGDPPREIRALAFPATSNQDSTAPSS